MTTVERLNDGLVKSLEIQSRQLDNQAETIDELRKTVNAYAARINELQHLVRAMDETTQDACAVATRAEKNRANAVNELGLVRGELLEARSEIERVKNLLLDKAKAHGFTI